jgi:hypothetical protein
VLIADGATNIISNKIMHSLTMPNKHAIGRNIDWNRMGTELARLKLDRAPLEKLETNNFIGNIQKQRISFLNPDTVMEVLYTQLMEIGRQLERRH